MASPPKDLNQELNNSKYIPKSDMPELSEAALKEVEKQKKELDKVKNWLVKKYKFTLSISLLPPQAVPKIEEEEDIPEAERKEKRVHVVLLIPEDNFKEIPKIKKEILEYTKSIKPKLWFHIITPVDVWNFLMDSRYDLSGAVAMSYPLYDTGFLGALRVAEVHKNLVLRKFERYVSTYAFGGSLVRGTATKDSDIDVFVIIDDTDIKRMSRIELREKLRGIIYQYIPEAQAIAGTKNKLEPQIYLLTDFWEAVKDAHPVMFTFIRDGIPLYDRGTFLPWKSLLKMGKIKPSPEAIDMFMASADKTKQMIDRRLIDGMIDAYYGILNPSQALLMLYGHPPTAHKETPKVFNDVFYEKEKLIEKKYVKILEKAVGLFRDYEHGKLKEIKGSEIDVLVKESEDYIKRMKKLREEIEKVSNKNTIEQIHEEVFKLLEGLFGKKSKTALMEAFEKELVKKAKFSPKMLTTLKDIEKVHNDFKKAKVKKKDIDSVRKDAAILISQLIDYGQRCDFVSIDKSRMQILTKKGERIELLITSKCPFLIHGTSVKKIEENKLKDSTIDEFNSAIKEQTGKLQAKFHPLIFEVIRREYGDFEVLL